MSVTFLALGTYYLSWVFTRKSGMFGVFAYARGCRWIKVLNCLPCTAFWVGLILGLIFGYNFLEILAACSLVSIAHVFICSIEE